MIKRNGTDGELVVLIDALVSSIAEEQSQQRRGMEVQEGKE